MKFRPHWHLFSQAQILEAQTPCAENSKVQLQVLWSAAASSASEAYALRCPPQKAACRVLSEWPSVPCRAETGTTVGVSKQHWDGSS